MYKRQILDWYLANTDLQIAGPEDDPGVRSVRRIYEHYKKHDYRTVVMGASFRNAGEIEALAGCDRLTISPDLMEGLAADHADLPRQLIPAQDILKAPPALSEGEFRWAVNEDQMVTEKLAEGIRRFAADQLRLEQLLAADH